MSVSLQDTMRLMGLSVVALLAVQEGHAADILYDQDFESPASYRNWATDFDKRTVNSLYGNQPPGFQFAQTFTVETVHLTGSTAYGRGFSDPSGIGGNYAIAMLQSLEDDRLGLSFEIGDRQFLNLRMDISSIVLDGDHFRFPNPVRPKFKLTLFDNPSGAVTIGEGQELDSEIVTGTKSSIDAFDWTSILVGLDASASTNGKVTLQIDLLEGDYAAFDNLRIAASDKEGDVGRRYAP